MARAASAATRIIVGELERLVNVHQLYTARAAHRGSDSSKWWHEETRVARGAAETALAGVRLRVERLTEQSQAVAAAVDRCIRNGDPQGLLAILRARQAKDATARLEIEIIGTAVQQLVCVLQVIEQREQCEQRERAWRPRALGCVEELERIEDLPADMTDVCVALRDALALPD